MKAFKFFFLMLAAGYLATVLSSCGEDDGPIFTNRPVTDISETTILIPEGGSFTVTLEASEGGSPLNTLTIQEDGVDVDAADITIDGNPTLNPLSLSGGLTSSFDVEITIQTDLGAGESAAYSFIVTADDGSNSVEYVNVTAEEAMPTVAQKTPGDIVDRQPGAEVTVPIIARPGNSPLHTIGVKADGVYIDGSRLTIGAMIVWDSNPDTLVGAFRDSINGDLVIKIHSEPSSTVLYEVIVTDEDGVEASTSFNITTVGSPVTQWSGLQVWNFSGPNNGGINLITGDDVGQSTDAHLRDLGIDGNGDWYQQLMGDELTTTLKWVTTPVTFADIIVKEEIKAIFDDTNNPEVTGATEVLEIGDQLVLLDTDGNYILVEMVDVVNTPSDNLDSFELQAKF